MKCFTAGLNSDGRSCVTSVQEWTPEARVFERWDLRTLDALPSGHGQGEPYDLNVSTGELRWIVVVWPPGLVHGMHWTNTLDMMAVLSGEVTLVLEVEEVPLRAGDFVSVHGVPHGWQVGNSGFVGNWIQIGT